MIKAPSSCEEAGLTAIAKSIQDLDDLARLLAKGLSRTKPWQQNIAAHLTDADRLLQLLPITIAMDRPDTEIVAAAGDLQLACQQCAPGLIRNAGPQAEAPAQAPERSLREDLALRGIPSSARQRRQPSRPAKM